jgi:hypothetical protein
VRRTAAAGLALAAALLAACAPHLLPAPPEAPTITGTWAENRDRFPAVSALADVTLDADGARLAWPEFTAVFAFHAPDRVAVTGFSPMGALLFSYESGDGRYTLRGPDPDRVKTGRLGARGADPESRLLGALVHVLDGVLGPDTGDTPVGVDPDGRWVVKVRGETLALTLDDGRVDGVEVRRRHTAPVTLAFGDFRDAGPLVAPYRIGIAVHSGRLSAEIRVQTWRMEATPETAAGPAPALTATRKSPYLDVPRPEPAAGPDDRLPPPRKTAGNRRSSGAVPVG